MHFVCELSSWLVLFFILALIGPLVWQLLWTWHWFVYSSSGVFREEDAVGPTFHHRRGIFIFPPFTVSVDPGCSTLHKSHEKLWIPINSCFFANFICQNTLHFSPPFRPASSGEAPLFTFLQAVWPLGQGWEQRSGRTSCLIHAGSELSVGSTLKTSLCPFRVPFRSFHLVSSWCQSAITWPLTLLLLIATSTSGRVWKTLAMSRNSNHATQPCHGSPSCCQQDGELLSLMRFIWREREGEWFGFGLVKSVRPFIWLFLTLKYN